MRRPFELEAEAFKLAVLRLAAERNVDSEVVVAALADVLGLTAATLDKTRGPVVLDERLDSFLERVRAQHRRTLLAMAMKVRPTKATA